MRMEESIFIGCFCSIGMRQAISHFYKALAKPYGDSGKVGLMVWQRRVCSFPCIFEFVFVFVFVIEAEERVGSTY